jgi:outer membrane protein assembly factor BamB
MELPTVIEQKKFESPAPAPQALTVFEGNLWMGSRDLRRLYQLDLSTGKVRSEQECPGTPWAAVTTGDAMRFTIGEGADDDRYVTEYAQRFAGGNGSARGKDGLPARFACPDLTGSYLSWDGRNLYLSQWYKHRILQFDRDGQIARSFDIGDEVSGHAYVNGKIYVLRGTEQNGEKWRIAQFDPTEDRPVVTDVARIPFACRSLTFDGTNFWSNHRAANTIISFTLPNEPETS